MTGHHKDFFDIFKNDVRNENENKFSIIKNEEVFSVYNDDFYCDQLRR